MNGVSRTGIVTVLVAAELAIVGIGVYSLRGGGNLSMNVVHASSSFVPKTFAPMAAGAAPRVTIDDPNSGIEVTASHDGLVHVVDKTSFKGGFFGATGRDYPQLDVKQSFSGIEISRVNYDIDWFSDATSWQHVEVEVPPATLLAITHSGGADVSDLNGGTVAVHSDDGHIKVVDVTTPSLELTTSDGHIEATDVTMTGASSKAHIHSDDGRVQLDGLFPAGGNYDVSSGDGSVHVALATGSDVTIDASTSDGSLSIDGERQRDGDDDDSHHQTVRVGGGSAAMQIHSDDGSVTITTNGVH